MIACKTYFSLSVCLAFLALASCSHTDPKVDFEMPTYEIVKVTPIKYQGDIFINGERTYFDGYLFDRTEAKKLADNIAYLKLEIERLKLLGDTK